MSDARRPEGFVIYDQDGNEIGRSLPGENLVKVSLHPGVRKVTTGPLPSEPPVRLPKGWRDAR